MEQLFGCSNFELPQFKIYEIIRSVIPAPGVVRLYINENSNCHEQYSYLKPLHSFSGRFLSGKCAKT